MPIFWSPRLGSPKSRSYVSWKELVHFNESKIFSQHFTSMCNFKYLAVDIAHMPVCLFLCSVRLISWVNFRVRFKEKGEMSDCVSDQHSWNGPDWDARSGSWDKFLPLKQNDPCLFSTLIVILYDLFLLPKFIDNGMECSSIFFPRGLIFSFLFWLLACF